MLCCLRLKPASTEPLSGTRAEVDGVWHAPLRPPWERQGGMGALFMGRCGL
jgi:hypothetical protein